MEFHAPHLGLFLRHFNHSDIPQRVGSLYDDKVRRNIASHLALTAKDTLTRRFERQVDAARPERFEFVITRRSGETVGFTYIDTLDWVNRTCEAALTMLPRYRTGFGSLAMMCTLDHLYGCLNMETVLIQVLDCNDMMFSKERIAARAQVSSPYANFTEGRYRKVHMWTQTRAEYQAMIVQSRERLRLTASRTKAGSGPPSVES